MASDEPSDTTDEIGATESLLDAPDSSPTATGQPDDETTEKVEPAEVAESAPASLAASTPAEPSQTREIEKMPRPRGRLGSAFSLGFSLSGVGFLAKASMAIAALTTLAAIGLVLLLARGDAPPLASVPGLTASALAWGGGFTFAVAAAARAFDRDASDGIRFLARTRGVSTGTYAIGRVLGLAVALMLIVGIGSLVTGGVCVAIAHGSRAVIGKATLATVAYAVAFGFAMAPLAAATLGARARGRGYIILLAVLVIPEVLQDSLESIPARFRGLFGIPSALTALRESLTPARFDAPLAGAAAAVIFVVALVALLFAIEQAFSAARTAESK